MTTVETPSSIKLKQMQFGCVNAGGGGGVLLHISYMGMCRCVKGMVFNQFSP